MMVAREGIGRLAYCAQCRRMVPVACGERGECPQCGRVLAKQKDDVMTKQVAGETPALPLNVTGEGAR